MANKKTGHLGSGLNNLFSGDLDRTVQDIKKLEESKNSAFPISLDQIKPNPYQPRRVFDPNELERLSQSIITNGLIQPIIVKQDVSGYILVVGERRLKAAKLANLETINAIVTDFDDQKMREIALVENIQRVDLTAVEEAEAFRGLIDVLKITQQELADRIHKSRAYVTNMMRLLHLPNKVKDLILQRRLSMGQARPLITLMDQPDKFNYLLKLILDGNLSSQRIEELVKKLKIGKKSQIRVRPPQIINQKLASTISHKLNTEVKLTNSSLIIRYKSVQELNEILEKLNLLSKD